MAEVILPQTVQEVVDKLAACYSDRDIEGLLAISSPAFIGFGSGSDEVVHSLGELRTALTRDFSQCDRLRMEFTEVHIREEIRAAWMIATCTITSETEGKVVSLIGRMTAVFRRISPGWQVAQTHFSMPYCRQEPGHSFPL